MRTVTTRIMQVDTDSYSVYRKSITQSTRVGTKAEYTLHGAVTGQLSPVQDNISLEIYGNRCVNMYTLTARKGADVQLDDKVMVGGDYFKVIAVLPFTGHLQATIEKVGALNGNT